MGSQTPQGLPPGAVVEGEQSRLEAIGTVLGAVALVVLVVVGVVYLGGWAAHVLVDIARSGWASK